MHNEDEAMERVTAAKPCPVCGKADWCLRRDNDTAAICQRVESAKRCGDAGWLHVLRDTPKVVIQNGRMNTMAKPSKTVNWRDRAEGFAAILASNPLFQVALAKKLSLPVEALDGFTLGVNGIMTDGAEFTIPERDEEGIVIGIATRIQRKEKEAEKKCITGSKRGLTIPDGWQDRSGPMYVVEGFTDTAAMNAAKLKCVGRPSNSGGAKHLAKLFVSLPVDVPIVIIGENDTKPNGTWPGRDGMKQVAKSLAKALARPIHTALPPQGVKDVRAWLTDPASGEATWEERGRELSDYLLKNAVVIDSKAEAKQASAAAREVAADAGREVVEGGKVDPTTDQANGIRFAREHHENARHTAERGWYAWNGERWVHDDLGALMRMAKKTAARLLSDATEMFNTAKTNEERDEAERLIDSAIGTQSKSRLTNMLALALSELPIPILLSDFDKLPDAAFLLNCPNGTLDLRSGELRPHSRDDMLTQVCPTPFDPSATCPTWERFVNDIFAGDAELISFVQRLLGYVLSGDTSIHVCPVLWGGGSNGKSVFLETVFEVMGGDYSGKAAPDLMIAKHGQAHPTERADLRGKRLVALTETAEGARIDEPLLKELTGGDSIKARFMKKDFFEFRPTHKVCIVTNHRPRVKEGGHGIWRRLRLIPFDVRFWSDGDEPGAAHLKADKGLKAKLVAEAPGILAWTAKGFQALQATGMELGTPAAVMNATKTYEESEDVVGQFIAERCELNSRAEEKAKDVYDAYVKWHESEGDGKPFSQKQFGTRLTARGIRKRKSGVYIYTGIRLCDQSTTDTDSGRLGRLDADSGLSDDFYSAKAIHTENSVQSSQSSRHERASDLFNHDATQFLNHEMGVRT